MPPLVLFEIGNVPDGPHQLPIVEKNNRSKLIKYMTSDQGGGRHSVRPITISRFVTNRCARYMTSNNAQSASTAASELQRRVNARLLTQSEILEKETLPPAKEADQHAEADYR
jgi:hypothetical protein